MVGTVVLKQDLDYFGVDPKSWTKYGENGTPFLQI